MADIFSLVGKVSIEYAQAKTALEKVSDAAEDTADSLGEVGDEADETGGKTEKSGGRMSGAFKKIGSIVAAVFAVDKIVDFGKAIVDASATVAAEESAFEQIMGDYSDTARNKMGKVADAVGMTDTRLTPYMTSMTAKFKGLGYGVEDATTLASDGLTLAADAATFWDKSLDESMSGLNSFINGSYEGGEAIGLFANDTQMASYAVKQGIVSETKEWANLDEARKQATRLQYAQDMMKASGATGQATKEAGQYANVQAELNEKWRQFKAQIGEPLLQNVVIPGMDLASKAIDKLSSGFEKAKGFIKDHNAELKMLGGVIVATTAGVSAFLLVMNWGSIVGAAIGLITKLKNGFIALNATMLANPIALVIAAIAALAAGFIYLWNTSEGFRNFWIGLWETIKTAASNVWEAIKAAADTVINALVTGWQSVAMFFSELWSSITNIVSTAWEFIKNIVSLGLQTIGLIISAAVQIITLPFQFIWENCKGIIQAAWNTIKNIVTTAVNAVKNIITTIFNAVKAFITNVMNVIKNIFTTVWNGIKTVITNVVNAIKTVVTNAWNAIKNVTTSVFNAVKSVASSIWNGIKTVISSVVDGVKSKVSSVWNSIKSTTSSVFDSIKSTASSVWNSIKSAIEKPTNAAKDAVKSAIDKMKSFFNFSWSLPKLKLPHISISGGFSIMPPKAPKFSIKWYKKAMDNAMLLNSPAIFGYDQVAGKFLGGGEAGTEVVSGANTLMGMIRDAVAAENANISYRFEQLIKLLETYMPEIIRNMTKNIYLDTGVLVGELGSGMDYELGNISKMRGRGM